MDEFAITVAVVTEHGTDTRTDGLMADSWGEALHQAANQVDAWAAESGVVIMEVKITQ